MCENDEEEKNKRSIVRPHSSVYIGQFVFSSFLISPLSLSLSRYTFIFTIFEFEIMIFIFIDRKTEKKRGIRCRRGRRDGERERKRERNYSIISIKTPFVSCHLISCVVSSSHYIRAPGGEGDYDEDDGAFIPFAFMNDITARARAGATFCSIREALCGVIGIELVVANIRQERRRRRTREEKGTERRG